MQIVDFGCSEMGFFSRLKHTPGIQEVICVDIDRSTLDYNKQKIEALTADFLRVRDSPLNVFVYEGSVTHNDIVLENTDAVVAIELIEHLYNETLIDVPANIFGFIKPLVAIITTPNADFNVLFTPMKGFRHPDHKFEWSRKEFEEWSHNIVHRYPDYEVTFKGICEGPAGTEHLGCCSQMAVFHRKHDAENIRIPGVEGLFKLVATEEYPFRIDNRPDEIKILDEATFFIRKFQMARDDEEMPLDYLTRVLDNLNITEESLRDILEHGGYEIRDDPEIGPSVICPPLSVISDNYGHDFCDELLNEDAFLSDYDSSEEAGPIVGHYDRWPAIQDHDNWDEEEENWDERLVVAIEEDDIGVDDDNSNLNSEIRELEDENELASNNMPTIIDELEITDLNIPNTSHVLSYGDEASIQISTYPETTGSQQESAFSQDDANQSTADDSINLKSMCSIYLETSCNENSQICPLNITDPNFQYSMDKISDDTFDNDDSDTPKLTSTPNKKIKNNVELRQPEVSRNNTETQNLRKLDTLIERNIAISSCESPTNSWSPEIMDSGYPNTCSAPDMTPEYDLPSIAQDSASDTESSSAAAVEPPRQGFLENLQVENGDLANNNRDGEGNNMIAADENDLDDLQPLIDVLENDMENENDIYVFQNGFPVWLLRIQDIEAAVINQPVFVVNNAPGK